jgi:hypothetical protein
MWQYNLNVISLVVDQVSFSPFLWQLIHLDFLSYFEHEQHWIEIFSCLFTPVQGKLKTPGANARIIDTK